MDEETIELILNTPSIQAIVDKGIALYETVKDQYEPHYKGKILAIEVEKGKFYLGDTGKEAIAKAKSENPQKLFYVMKIGFTPRQMLIDSFTRRS